MSIEIEKTNLNNQPSDIKNKKTEAIKVSVCIIAYNQAEYIAECLESIVNQSTSFLYEVIVRDDASTDETLNVILDFQKRYPLIIKVLDSSKNIGMNSNLLAVLRAAQGEYIALCEGDDYWIDEKKLEKQINNLNENPQVDICCHPVFIQEEGLINYRKKTGELSKQAQIIPLTELIKRDGGSIATPSIMIRRPIVVELPKWFEQAPVGDYFLQVYGARRGGCLFLSDVMGIYRKNRPNSWSTQMSDFSKKHAFIKQFIRFINLLSKEWKGTYEKEFRMMRAQMFCNLALYSALLGIKKEFKIYINLSWLQGKGFSKHQKIMYYLRAAPLILFHFFYKLGKILRTNLN